MEIGESGVPVDLRVERVGHVEAIVPSEPTDDKPLRLSVLDHHLVIPVETIRFFAPNPRRPTTDLISTLRDALGQVLIPYHFLAGRLRRAGSKRLEVDCNRSGAHFTQYRSGFRIADLGSLELQNPVFRQLLPHDFGTANILLAPLLAVQVTTFACGGFAVGFMINHALMDGAAMGGFQRNFGAIARGEGLLFTPENDRSYFMARDPPVIKYDHPELQELSVKHMQLPFPTATDSTSEEVAQWKTGWAPTYVNTVFSFTPGMIKTLKEQALEGGLISKVSTFEVLAAHIWVARTKALELPEDKPFHMLFAVDVRKIMKPTLSPNYAGNAALHACARATPKQVKKYLLSEAVQAVQQAVAKVTDDFARSWIDRRAMSSVGLQLCGGFVLSAWYNLLDPAAVDYGWGKALLLGPCASPSSDFVLLLNNYRQDGGVNLKIHLRPEEMNRFRSVVKIEEHLHSSRSSRL